MNDNNSQPGAEELRFLRTIQGLNIAANGRWCVLVLAAICIARGDMRGALLMALVLGASVIVEQIPNEQIRRILIHVIYCWVAVFIGALAVVLSW